MIAVVGEVPGELDPVDQAIVRLFLARRGEVVRSRAILDVLRALDLSNAPTPSAVAKRIGRLTDDLGAGDNELIVSSRGRKVGWELCG